MNAHPQEAVHDYSEVNGVGTEVCWSDGSTREN
jgi:hypothetical protein